jgi:hypothetical protein
LKYAIKISEDGRVEYATFEQYASSELFIVDSLPDGDIHDYYYADGEFCYSPLPREEEPDIPSMEERVMVLEDELEATKIILGVE